MRNNILFALLASIGTWGLTALGSAIVLFFKAPKHSVLNLMLGFSAGVMIAASFWSLLQPAIEQAKVLHNTPAYIIVTIGFLFGALFIWLCDKIISLMLFKNNYNINNNSNLNRVIILILSITLHNIPEGFAIGVAFGLLKDNYDFPLLMGAISIAIGIGLQNFPEGAAVSLPLKREGYSNKKSFFFGQLSAIVEPISAVIGASIVSEIVVVLPFALSFAAGAMILVSVHELIPECQKNNRYTYIGTAGIILGFSTMMLLDVALG